LDESGGIVAERYRTGLRKPTTGDDIRFRWKKGSTPTLYGRNWLDIAREAGYVFLVEGESDAHTLWYYGKPCVAVPGARNWDDAWGALLEGIPRIYVFVEPDAAGEKLWRAVSNCPALKGRVRRVVPE
jgi:DNA primase